MFENLLGQAASDQLVEDIKTALLAPAMLFSGPPASGKGTAALELARIVSCEDLPPDSVPGHPDGTSARASWKCQCPSCSRHRLLIHPDLLCLGWKPFYAEIAACAGAFQRDASQIEASQTAKSSASRMLFIRSVRKLLARFNPVLWEDDPKAGKISPLVSSIDEDLDEVERCSNEQRLNEQHSNEKDFDGQDSPAKIIEGILKSVLKLESEGLSENVPIAQIRRAAWWGRLAPTGRAKMIIIENADRMQEEARNSLLKLLEEPPSRLYVVLTSPRQGSLPQTILSRLRPYRFVSRGAALESDVIRRVFRDEAAASLSRGIGVYLDSFLPVTPETLGALAAFFAASVAYKAAILLKKQGRPLPEELVLLGKSSAPRTEAAGLGRPLGDPLAVVSLIMEKASNFEMKTIFSRFLSCLLEQVSVSQRTTPSLKTPPFLPPVSYNDKWKDFSKWAETAVCIYNLKPTQVLEKFFTDISRGIAGL